MQSTRVRNLRLLVIASDAGSLSWSLGRRPGWNALSLEWLKVLEEKPTKHYAFSRTPWFSGMRLSLLKIGRSRLIAG